ncbi:unnamed protein product [Lasius platythorax]|uniref:RING-type domain-containing protein n=1 Tax=Lasius platythorax TaxID=488582 RepID=A0AAV2NUW5_9HYME
MDLLICNKCFIPIYRGKQPFNITQCGHIFCQNCLQQVEKQCPQCQYISPVYLSLEEPVMPKMISFFGSLDSYTEIWETLLKANTLRCSQTKITMQRFHELDEKYEKLKNQCFLDQRNFKMLTEKYTNLKKEKENVSKKIQQLKQNFSLSVSKTMKTPTDSYPISMNSSNTRFTPGILSFMNFSNVTPMSIQSIDPNKQRQTDGFCASNNPNSGKSLFTPNTSSNYTFMK